MGGDGPSRCSAAILTLWTTNYEVYGIRKLWKALARAGEPVGRDQVARLMRQLGIQGARRGKRIRTTRPDASAARHPDLVDRRFVAERPNLLWVTDLTVVPTWAGAVYVCFITELGAVPSIGSVGDSYDNALAEAVNSLYKTELIRRQGTWRSVDDVELATLQWVHWFNTQRLHSTLGDIPPVEFEAAAYSQQPETSHPVGIQ